MPLNLKKKDHGLEENSAVATQVMKENYKHVGILSGKVKDIGKDQRERYDCSGRSIEQVNTEEGSKRRPSDVSSNLSRMMCDLLHHQSAPEVEIKTFRGDPLEYHYFISVFGKVVELKIDDSHGRLVWLLKYTEGESRDTIKHCIQQTQKVGIKKQSCCWKDIMEIHIKFWQLT